MNESTPIPLQDAGPSRKAWSIPTYHTHGLRQYLGTCKVHAHPNCPHLLAWKPPKKLAKVIMREWEDSLDAVPLTRRCKTCWPNAQPRG